MSVLLAAALAVLTLLAGVTGVGAVLLYLRRGLVRERDEVRSSAIDSWKAASEAEERLCEARLAERDDWIGALEGHHSDRHARCSSLPSRHG